MITGNIFNKMSVKVKARESSHNFVHLSPSGEHGAGGSGKRRRRNLAPLPEVRDLNVYQSGLDL